MKVRQAGDSAVGVGVLNAVALRNTNREPAHIGALGNTSSTCKEQGKGIA
ncbi:MAG: hypothetical protein QXQ65_04775 [Conexivisphaerales archaeon]